VGDVRALAVHHQGTALLTIRARVRRPIAKEEAPWST
jgi:hypothetical protein